MKNYLALFVAAVFFLTNCKSNGNHGSTQTDPGKDTAKISFFPVSDFLRGQAAEFDSLQTSVLHTITSNGKTDSIWEKRENIRALLHPFFAEEINENNLTAVFKPTKFLDQTVNAVTFTYDPIQQLPDSVSLRHWDLYINPETGKVNKIYMLRAITENGKNYIQQLTWQTDKWAKIVVLPANQADSALGIKEEKIIWRFD